MKPKPTTRLITRNCKDALMKQLCTALEENRINMNLKITKESLKLLPPP